MSKLLSNTLFYTLSTQVGRVSSILALPFITPYFCCNIYIQKFATAALSLVTIPLLLKGLGVEDYGIYTLTLGLVALFGFISFSLSGASQRFIAYSIGAGDNDSLKKSFTTGFYLHLLLGLLFFIVLSLVAIFFISDIINVPVEKFKSARLLVLILGAESFLQMVAIPFQGVIKASEDLKYISFSGILESILKLLAAAYIFVNSDNSLVVFGYLIFIINVLVLLFYIVVSQRKYNFCGYNIKDIDKRLVKDMGSFTGWNMIGTLAITGKNQGLSVVLNRFYGVLANSALGIAMQVQTAIAMFSQGMVSAMAPRLMKSAGGKDHNLTLEYALRMSKYSTWAISLASIPVLINVNHLLEVWLGEVPIYTETFVVLVLVYIFANSLAVGLKEAFMAIGGKHISGEIKYPKFSERTACFSNVSILGDVISSENVIFGAKSNIIGGKYNENSLVLGSYPNNTIKTHNNPIIEDVFQI